MRIKKLFLSSIDKCLFVACVTLFAASFNRAAADELKPLQLKFVDVYGAPIEGVKVIPGSLVFADDSGSSYGVKNLKTVEGGDLITDSQGVVIIAIPDYRLGELRRFNLQAKHNAFAEFNDWVNVDEGELNQVTLSLGVQIAITAIDAETGEPITKNLYGLAEQKDLDRMVDWKFNEKGLLVSRRLRDADKRIRIVQIENGAAVRFSDVIDVKPGEGERTLIRDVPMVKAKQLVGRIDESIPRPIRNGIVSVCVAWPTKTEIEDYGPAGHWLTNAPIAEDGTFQLNGLPSGNWLQVIASCDGGFNQPAAAPIRLAAFPGENRLIDIEDSILPALVNFEQPPDQITISMQPTVKVTFQTIDEEDHPVGGVKLFASRQQRFFQSSWNSREFGSRNSTARALESARTEKEYQPDLAEQIQGQTDDQGIVHLANIPGNRFLVRAEGFSVNGDFSYLPIELSGQEMVKLSVVPESE